MKQYKYRVNGQTYDVVINEINGKNAKVEVNGISFDVEMEGEGGEIYAAQQAGDPQDVPQDRPLLGGDHPHHQGAQQAEQRRHDPCTERTVEIHQQNGDPNVQLIHVLTPPRCAGR